MASSIWRRYYCLYETLGMMMRLLLMMLLLEDLGGCVVGDFLFTKKTHDDQKPQNNKKRQFLIFYFVNLCNFFGSQIDETKKSETDEIRNCRYFSSKICHNDLFIHQSKNVQEKKLWHPLMLRPSVSSEKRIQYYQLANAITIPGTIRKQITRTSRILC